MRNLLFLTLLAPSLAFGYQTELSGMYEKTDYKNNGQFRSEAIGATRYFTPVEVGSSPYAEAYFLKRMSSISVAAFKINYEISSVDGDGNAFFGGVELMRKESPLYLSVNYGKSHAKLDVTPSVSIDTKFYQLNPGFFINDTSLVTLLLSRSTTDIDGSSYDTSNIGIAAKTIVNNILNLEGAISQDSRDSIPGIKEKNRIYSIAADYYVNQGLSFGARYEFNSGDYLDDEGNIFGLRTSLFATKNFGMRLTYDRFSANTGTDTNDLSFIAVVRF